MTAADEDRYWAAFQRRFDFRPGVDPSTWPAIREPSPSVTVDISAVYADATGRTAAFDRLALRAMTEAFPSGTRLVAIDYNHLASWFEPHRQAADADWLIPPFPNGDYYVFLTEDMTAGMFGHPWEKTECVFGRPLVDAFVAGLPDWLPIVRAKP